MAYQRSIDIAYDKQTGEQYDAHSLFKTAKEGYEIRRRYNAGELEINCCKCGQALIVSDSKNDRLHFKHFPNANDCPLKDGGMTNEEVKEYNDILRARESSRHKFLKNRIAELLNDTEGVEPGSVAADTQFFFSDVEKRRPDVYGVYKGKKMAFEIQLSNLSQRYLLGRHNFYKGKGIYLVWILDNFDVQGQSKMERDIKYLTPSQNFFKLDESVHDFKLFCTYKSPFITKENTILSPWRTKSVAMSEIQFSGREYQVYYLNYEQKLKEAQLTLEKKIEKDAEEEREERRRVNREAAEKSAETVIKKLKDYRARKWDFYKFHEELDRLSYIGLEVLNERFGFDTRRPKGLTLLNYYIANTPEGQFSFIKYLLGDKRIVMDVNAVDDDGTTTFQQIMRNRNLDYRQPLIKSLFKRGYRLADGDIEEHGLLDMHEGDKAHELMALKWCDQLETKELVDDVYNHLTFLFAVESARRKEIFGFGYKNWISFAVQAIIKHRDNWVISNGPLDGLDFGIS
jgi:competence CoiA-like predicted nuclease